MMIGDSRPRNLFDSTALVMSSFREFPFLTILVRESSSTTVPSACLALGKLKAGAQILPWMDLDRAFMSYWSLRL